MNGGAFQNGGAMIDIRELHLRVAKLDLLPPGLTFGVERGRRVGVTGPSGCGKTTLLRGIAAGAFPEGARHQTFSVATTRIGYVPQRSGLFPWLTLGRNMEFFAARADVQRVDEAKLLEVVGLTGRRNHFPAEMSGGETQRAILACGLAAAPDLMLIDEPLTGVDSSTKWRILSWLSTHIQDWGMTLVVVSHDLDVLSFLTDSVVVFAKGQDRPPVEVGEATPHPRSWEEIGPGAVGDYRGRIMRSILAQAAG